MSCYTGWVDAVGDTEDATARALHARDRLAACRLWLSWQARRRPQDAPDIDAALADIDCALAVLESTLAALRTHRGALRHARPEG